MRKIMLKGANNARDFGSIENKDGKKIKSGCFLRSNKLSKINSNDIEILKKLNLKTIIDLRTTVEMTDAPDIEIEGVELIHIPIFSEEVMGITHENNQNKIKMLSALPDLKEIYKTIVTDEKCISMLKKAFSVICDFERDGSVLWHCTEGKDRCGIVSALFLLLLDVDKETVFEDYLETNKAAQKKADKYYFLIKNILRKKKEAETVRELYLAKEDFLQAALCAIEENYGDVQAFIRNKLEISDEVKAKMKEKYLV